MVNIIIPIYNARETLPKTLDSLVAQTKNLFMVTLVQDADNIDYSDIVEEYRHRGLNITLEVLSENVGPGLARQRGIDMSSQFEYVMFLDSDDLLQPRAIDVLTREVKKNDLDILSSSFVVERPGVDTYVKGDGSASTWVLGKIYRRAYLVDNNKIEELRIVYVPSLVDAKNCIEGIASILKEKTKSTKLKLITFRKNGVRGELENHSSPSVDEMNELKDFALKKGFTKIELR